MKDLDYYMSLPYRVEIFPDADGGYAAKVLDLPGCITCAPSWSELLYMINDAKKSWLATALACGDVIPEPAYQERLSA
ncbi:MAG: type II toxin-antitoxin system HicB family antitoxin [Selenomonadaceae bacterium]|nr:type II toxin-antitoxin system HicB family antitoxin [Selenomonadaceae bacterium]